MKDGTTALVLPPSLPRQFAGTGVYKVQVATIVANKRRESDVGLVSRYELQYWTPCILKFSPNFTDGQFIDENSMVGYGANRFLDALVTGAAKENFGVGGVATLAKTPAYIEGIPLLRQLADAQMPSSPLATLTPGGILARRQEIFNLEGKAWELATRLLKRTPTEEIKDAQSGAKTGEADYSVCHEWFSQLKSVVGKEPWQRTVAAIVSGHADQSLLRDAEALATPLLVKKKSLPGYFVSQPFVVTSVDENGQLSLQVEAVITDILDPGNRNVYYWHAPLSSKKSDATVIYNLGGIFEDDTAVSREITLFPVED